MKPYCETYTLEGMLEAPIEMVWALHTDPEKLCSVFSRVLSVEVLSGEPGKVGLQLRYTVLDAKGRTRTVESEVIEARPGRNVTTRTTLQGVSRVRQESTRFYKHLGNRTRSTLVLSVQTRPVFWIVRLLLRLTSKRRAKQAAALFEADLAEENAYYGTIKP